MYIIPLLAYCYLKGLTCCVRSGAISKVILPSGLAQQKLGAHSYAIVNLEKLLQSGAGGADTEWLLHEWPKDHCKNRKDRIVAEGA